MSRGRSHRPAAYLLAVLAACTPVPPVEQARPEVGVPVLEDPERDLPPPGLGSLRQDDFSVEIEDGSLRVKLTPLTEEVIRLAAPDTYDRLHALARSRSAEAVQATEGPGAELFLVSFFSREPNVEYRPEELQVTHRGRSQRPSGILPLTTGWGRHLLQPQRAQSAIYVFEPPFDYGLPLTVRYGLRQSDDWHREVLPRLDDERNRVKLRAGSRTP